MSDAFMCDGCGLPIRGIAEHSPSGKFDDGEISVEWKVMIVREKHDYCNDCLGKKIGNMFRRWLLQGVMRVPREEVVSKTEPVKEAVNKMGQVKEGVKKNARNWLTTREVIKETGVCQTTLSRLARSGKVNAIRKGKMLWLFDRDDILRYLSSGKKIVRKRKKIVAKSKAKIFTAIVSVPIGGIIGEATAKIVEAEPIVEESIVLKEMSIVGFDVSHEILNAGGVNG